MTVLNLFKILLACATAALIVGTGTVAGLFWHFSHGLPDHKTLADYQPATVSRLYAADGRLLAEYAHEKRVFVPVAAMPKRVLRGLRRGRGPALLHPSRHRLHRRDPRRDRQRRQPRQAAGGRLGHHPAGRQELPADQPGHPGAQDPRSHPGLPHRGHLLEGAHPRALSQRDLSRLGQLRRGPGGDQLFRPLAGRAHPVGDRLSRGAAQGAQPLQHRAQRERGLRPARLRARSHAGGRLHHLGRDAAGQGREAAAAPPRRHRGRDSRLLRRGSPPQPPGGLRREGPLRGRPHRQHHARSGHPGGRRQVAARRPHRLRPPPRLARPLRQDRRHGRLGRGIRPHRPAPAAQRPARLATRRGHQGRGPVGEHRRPARRGDERRTALGTRCPSPR